MKIVYRPQSLLLSFELLLQTLRLLGVVVLELRQSSFVGESVLISVSREGDLRRDPHPDAQARMHSYLSPLETEWQP